MVRAAAGGFSEALEAFDSLAASEVGDPWCRAERAAYEIAVALSTGDPKPLLRALVETSEIAGEAAPIAAFNRAAALEHLGLNVPAAALWTTVGAMEEADNWRELANSRAEGLTSKRDGEVWLRSLLVSGLSAAGGPPDDVDRAAAERPHLARQVGIEVVLREASEHIRNGNREAANDRISIAERLGVAIADSGGDPTLALVGREARAVFAARDDEAPLWQGLIGYSEGRAALRAENYSIAAARLAQAERELASSSSVLRNWATYGVAVADFFLGYRDDARSNYLQLQNVVGEDLPALAAHLEWSLGVVADLSGDLKTALSAFDRSIAQFDELQEADGSVNVRSLRAHVLFDLGREAEAAEDLWKALLRSREVVSESTLEFLLDAWLRLLCERQAESTAALFQDELLRIARSSGRASAIAHAHLMRAGNRLRSPAERLAELDLASDATESISDPRERARKAGLIATARSGLLLDPDPARAASESRRALELFDRLELKPLRLSALRTLSKALQRSGDLVQSEAVLSSAVEELQEQQRREPDWAARVELLRDAQPVFTELAELRMRHLSDSEGAFRAIETGRSAAIVASLESHARLRRRSGPASSSEVAAALPPGAVLIECAVFEDGLNWWTIREGRMDSAIISISREDLLRAATTLARAFALGDQKIDQLSRDFSALVLGPLSATLGGSGTLIVVPDPVLPLLPWGSLTDPNTEMPLVASRPVQLAPSSTVYAALRSLSETENGPMSIRALGDPAFDRSLFPHLDPLPHSRAEASALVVTFPRGQRLVGPEATASALLAPPLPEILHIAAHGLAPPFHGVSAALVLAPEPSRESGLLMAGDIGRRSLAGIRVVVLSACASSRGSTGPAEGELGLAQAFLAAGVPSVVATLWPIDDKGAADFASRLHHRLRTGQRSGAALRELILESSENGQPRPSHPLMAFVAIGAD